ncbi:MAG TPA: hypothetical protein DCL54_06895 [Alphaproteobacteria bacterium]|nr:hypothetical protein [Alphaproteobacteria bacterium]
MNTTADIIIASEVRQTRYFLEELLRSIGHNSLKTAVDVADCVRMIERARPKLVIADFETMADMVALLHQVRRKQPHPSNRLPIIAVMGVSTRAAVDAMRDQGATDIIAKPVTIARVKGSLANVLADSRAFITSEGFVGPDRRRFADASYQGPWRRATDKKGGRDGDIFNVDVK